MLHADRCTQTIQSPTTILWFAVVAAWNSFDWAGLWSPTVHRKHKWIVCQWQFEYPLSVYFVENNEMKWLAIFLESTTRHTAPHDDPVIMNVTGGPKSRLTAVRWGQILLKKSLSIYPKLTWIISLQLHIQDSKLIRNYFTFCWPYVKPWT